MRTLYRLARATQATAMIEFAMLALPFIVLTIGGIQLMIVLLTQQMIETAAEAVGRKILTGYVQQNNLTKAQFVTLACGLLPATLDCKKLIIDVQVAQSFSGAVTSKPNLSSYASATKTTVLTYNPGTAGQIVVLRLVYALPVVKLPGFNLQSTTYGFNFPMATSVFKIEAYS